MQLLQPCVVRVHLPEQLHLALQLGLLLMRARALAQQALRLGLAGCEGSLKSLEGAPSGRSEPGTTTDLSA